MAERLSKGMRKHIRQELSRIRRERHDPNISREKLGFYARQKVGQSSSSPITGDFWCTIAGRTCEDVSNPNAPLGVCFVCPTYVHSLKVVREEIGFPSE